MSYSSHFHQQLSKRRWLLLMIRKLRRRNGQQYWSPNASTSIENRVDLYTLHYFHFPILNWNLKVIFTQILEFQSSLLKFSCEDKTLLVTRKSCGLYYFLELFFFSSILYQKQSKTLNMWWCEALAFPYTIFIWVGLVGQIQIPQLKPTTKSIHKRSTDFQNLTLNSRFIL